MVNTLGLKKADVLRALEAYAGCRFGPAGNESGVFAAIIKSEMVVVDLRADDGFCEFGMTGRWGPGPRKRR